MLAAVAALLVSMHVAPTPLDILAIGDAATGSGLPPAWTIRRVRGEDPPHAEIRRRAGEAPVLAVEGSGRAAWFVRELSNPIEPVPGSLIWSWRVLDAPLGSDLQLKKLDDSAIRLFVVFGKPGGLFGGSGRVIFYSHGNAEPEGYARESHVSGRMHVVRTGGAGQRQAWREHVVDPFADYRRIWRRDPPEITAIGVMQDTDQTRQRAEAEVRRIEWLPR